MEPVYKFRVNGSGDFTKNVSNVLFSFLFIRTASWTSGTFGNGPSRQVDVLMGVEISPRTFLTFFLFLFYRNSFLETFGNIRWFFLFLGCLLESNQLDYAQTINNKKNIDRID